MGERIIKLDSWDETYKVLCPDGVIRKMKVGQLHAYDDGKLPSSLVKYSARLTLITEDYKYAK